MLSIKQLVRINKNMIEIQKAFLFNIYINNQYRNFFQMKYRSDAVVYALLLLSLT
jgi:hypothetical protein